MSSTAVSPMHNFTKPHSNPIMESIIMESNSDEKATGSRKDTKGTEHRKEIGP